MCIFCEANYEEMKEYGEIFGYPDCCIQEFISDTKTMEETGVDVRNDMQITIAINTRGFVPCKMHAEMIEYGEITPEELVVKKRNIRKARKLNKMVLLHEH